MNRRILIQVTAPAVVIGLFMFGACLVSAWYINRLQTNMVSILSRNVASLRAGQQMEISLRQLRFHCFINLIDPDPSILNDIHLHNQTFEQWLKIAQDSADTPEEIALIKSIEAGYDRYLEGQQDQDALARLRAEIETTGPRRDYSQLAEAHPIRHVIVPCHELLRLNEEEMAKTSQENERLSRILRLTLLFLGLVGPASGLMIGFSVARGLSRSIYQLSVRVQDMALQLEQNGAAVNLSANGDIQHLDQQLQHVVSCVSEVGERLQRQQREMLRAQQLAAVGQLAASVAHEVRNPLTSIKLLVEAGLRNQNPKPFTNQNLKVVHGEILRLEQTVQNFLDFARPPALERQPCDLRDVIRQAVELVRARARQQNIQIDVNCPERIATVEVDRGQICTVLVNLFINAVDAMPRGGKLSVHLKQTAAAGITVTVTDTGDGICPDMLEKLFTPFSSSKPTGSGLGLSICKRILEEHGGTIAVSNGPGVGARFTIQLQSPANERTYADTFGH